jgi:hypothetical protein
MHREQRGCVRRMGDIDAELAVCRRHGIRNSPAREALLRERAAVNERLQELRIEVRRAEAGIGRAKRIGSLGALGGLSPAATLREVAHRVGNLENVYGAACAWADGPNSAATDMLRRAVKQARRNLNAVEPPVEADEGDR